MRRFLMVLAAGMILSAGAASKVRLVYGEKWSRAGRDVRKMMESAAWKSAARSKYVAEFVSDDTGKPDGLNLGSLKLPCIFVLDEKDRCYCVIENVPYDATAEKIIGKIQLVDRKRTEIMKKYGTETAEGCGELMFAMERYVGGPRRVIDKNFYGDVFEKLKKLDPEDKTGWQRHFTMGDGIEIVTTATDFRKKGDEYAGEKYVEEQRKLPSQHLTLEQKQALLMARFAVYAPDNMDAPWTHPKRDEMKTLLRRICEASEHTLWGTAALGWLACPALGEPQLSTYWGWRRGDFKTGKFEAKVKYGVQHSFSRPGEYVVEFERTEGANVKVDSIVLCCGDEEVVKANAAPFSVKLPRGYAGKLTHMLVRGTAGGESAGRIHVRRVVLRPRKETK